jgi:hypothetical protein
MSARDFVTGRAHLLLGEYPASCGVPLGVLPAGVVHVVARVLLLEVFDAAQS